MSQPPLSENCPSASLESFNSFVSPVLIQNSKYPV